MSSGVGGVVQPTRLRDDPDFRRYWVARMASLFGSLVTAVAMPVLVYRLSGSTTLTALTTTLEALPYLLFGLFSARSATGSTASG